MAKTKGVIEVHVSGGCVDIAKCPRGVEVVIKDWDNCEACGGILCCGGHEPCPKRKNQ